MTHSTPADHHLNDTSREPTMDDHWHSKEAEIAWLRSKVLELQFQLEGRRGASKATEWTAALLGAIGAILLATNFHPGWGFAFFLASNAVWLRYAVPARLWGMVAQQTVFTGTSVMGLWVWWIEPIYASSRFAMLFVSVAGELLAWMVPALMFFGGLAAVLYWIGAVALKRRKIAGNAAK